MILLPRILPVLVCILLLTFGFGIASAVCTTSKIWSNPYYEVYEIKYSPTVITYILKSGDNAILEIPIVFKNPKVEKNDKLKVYEDSKSFLLTKNSQTVLVVGTKSMQINGVLPYSDKIEVWVLRNNNLELLYEGSSNIYRFLDLSNVKAIVFCTKDYTCGIGFPISVDSVSPSYMSIGSGMGKYCNIYWSGIKVDCVIYSKNYPSIYSIALVKGYNPKLAYTLAGQSTPIELLSVLILIVIALISVFIVLVWKKTNLKFFIFLIV